MSRAVIAYDKDLPEVRGRCAWKKPTSYLVKDPAAPIGWREEKEKGRRSSTLLLVARLRAAVDQWRDEGYPEASDVSLRLFEYCSSRITRHPNFLPWRSTTLAMASL